MLAAKLHATTATNNVVTIFMVSFLRVALIRS
jgi:hypothetical protein